MKNIQYFDTNTEYDSSIKEKKQISYTKDTNEVFFYEKIISFTATYQSSGEGSETQLYYNGALEDNIPSVDNTSIIRTMSIDGVEHKELPRTMAFNDNAEHTVKFEFVDARLTSLRGFFYRNPNLICVDFTDFKVSNLTDTPFMFYFCQQLNCTRTDFSKFDTSKVIDMTRMFGGTINIDLRKLNTSSVIYCKGIVSRNQGGEIIIGDDFLPSVTVMKDRNGNTFELKSFISQLTESVTIGNNFMRNYTGTVTNFINCNVYRVSQITIGDNFLEKVKKISTIVGQCLSIKSVTIGKDFCPSVESCSDNMYGSVIPPFNRLNNGGENVNFTYGNGFFKNATSLNGLFFGIHASTFDLNNLNTSKVTDMGGMFTQCINLTSLDLAPLDTTNVTDMNSMFSYCSSLTSLDLKPLKTTNVTDMNRMFSYCSSLTSLDLTPLDMSSVTDMQQIFSNCSSLTSIDFSSINNNINNVTDYRFMFRGLPQTGTLKYNKAYETKWNEIFTEYPLPSGWTKKVV